MLWLLERILFVVGATCTAAVSGALLAVLCGSLVFPTGRGAGGSVVAYAILAGVATVIGAAVGLVISLQWIRIHPDARWSWGGWSGALFGVCAGSWASMSLVSGDTVLTHLVAWLPGRVLFITTTAFIGTAIGEALLRGMQGDRCRPS